MKLRVKVLQFTVAQGRRLKLTKKQAQDRTSKVDADGKVFKRTNFKRGEVVEFLDAEKPTKRELDSCEWVDRPAEPEAKPEDLTTVTAVDENGNEAVIDVELCDAPADPNDVEPLDISAVLDEPAEPEAKARGKKRGRKK